MKRLIPVLSLLFIVFSLAACDTGGVPEAALPTLFEPPTLNPSGVPSRTPVFTWTSSFTPTITLTPSVTSTPTVTPSLTITDTITPVPTNTPYPTYAPSFLDDLVGTAFVTTPIPTGLALTGIMTPTPFVTVQTGQRCPYPPPGGFGLLFAADPTIGQQLGCPLGVPPVATTLVAASQPFERGMMFWVAGTPNVIYALYTEGSYLSTTDTFIQYTDPESGGETPPPGLFEPIRGFGKVWRTIPDVRSRLGWATAPESSAAIVQLGLERGQMIALSTRGDILLLNTLNGTWRSAPGSY